MKRENKTLTKELKSVRETTHGTGPMPGSPHLAGTLTENLDTFTGIIRDLQHSNDLISKKKYLKHIISTVDRIHEMMQVQP